MLNLFILLAAGTAWASPAEKVEFTAERAFGEYRHHYRVSLESNGFVMEILVKGPEGEALNVWSYRYTELTYVHHVRSESTVNVLAKFSDMKMKNIIEFDNPKDAATFADFVAKKVREALNTDR